MRRFDLICTRQLDVETCSSKIRVYTGPDGRLGIRTQNHWGWQPPHVPLNDENPRNFAKIQPGGRRKTDEGTRKSRGWLFYIVQGSLSIFSGTFIGPLSSLSSQLAKATFKHPGYPMISHDMLTSPWFASKLNSWMSAHHSDFERCKGDALVTFANAASVELAAGGPG